MGLVGFVHIVLWAGVLGSHLLGKLYTLLYGFVGNVLFSMGYHWC